MAVVIETKRLPDQPQGGKDSNSQYLPSLTRTNFMQAWNRSCKAAVYAIHHLYLGLILYCHWRFSILWCPLEQSTFCPCLPRFPRAVGRFPILKAKLSVSIPHSMLIFYLLSRISAAKFQLKKKKKNLLFLWDLVALVIVGEERLANPKNEILH